MFVPRFKGGGSANTTVVYAVVACVGLLVVWQFFLMSLLGLPAGANSAITAVLLVIAGLVAIAGISLTLVQRVTLESTQIRIRTGLTMVETYTYDQIEALIPEGDKVTIIYKDGGRQTVRNLRFGDGMSLSQINSLITESRPELSIMDAGER